VAGAEEYHDPTAWLSQFQERPLLWPAADAGVAAGYLLQQMTSLNEAE